MTSQQLKVIFGILALVAGLYVATLLVGRSGRGGEVPDVGLSVSPNLQGLVIARPAPADSVVLRKSEDGWTVNGYPADTALVREALNDLATARPGRLVARNRATHSRLGVSADAASRVRVISDNAVAFELLLGGQGADGRYVRQPDSDDVYTVPAASVMALGRAASEWRSRLIATLDTSSVTRIAIRRRDERRPVTLRRQVADSSDTWLEGSAVAEAAVVASLLREVAELAASGFPADSIAFAADFSQPAATLELFDSEVPGVAPNLSLLFLTASDAPDFLVRRADQPLVYRISADQAERLLPSRATLLP